MAPGVKRKREENLVRNIDASRYARTKHAFDANTEDLIFQLLECEDASKDKVEDDSSLIRLHGVTESGASVIVLVRSFRQYLYFPVSTAFEESDFAAFEEAIKHNTKTPVSIDSLEIVKRDPLEYYRGNPEDYQRYVKIYVQKPTDVNQIGTILGKSDELPYLLNLYKAGKLYSSQVYETGLAFDMRFMADLGIVGCGWVKIPAGKYKSVASRAPYERITGLFECQHDVIKGLSPDSTEADDEKTKLWSKIADLRCLILSCITLDSKPARKSASLQNSPKKPKSSKIVAKAKPPTSAMSLDEPEPFVSHISLVMTLSPTVRSAGDKTVVLTHGRDSTATISDAPNLEVICFIDERSMLQAFHDIVIAYDPDVISGYDITSESIPSILSRALDLKLPKDYINLARCSHTSLKTKTRQIYSGAWLKKDRKMTATSNREHTELGCIGRLVLDLRTVIEREERLRTYSLNETSAVIGGKTLELLSDTVLLELWSSEEGDDQSRLVDYTLNEVAASLNILRQHASLITYM